MSFLEIGIVGALLSGLIQLLKKKFGTESTETKMLTIVLALLVGGVMHLLQGTGYWEGFIQFLMAASTVYALFINK